MTLSDDHIAALEQADLTVREAKVLYENARALRDREIRRIAAEGGTYREIASVSSVAYQRVAQVVTGKEPPTRPHDDELAFECPKCGAGVGVKCDGAGTFGHAERSALALDAFAEKHPELG